MVAKEILALKIKEKLGNLKKDVLIVAVNDFSFKWAKEKNIYAFPDSTRREVSNYVAFYRTAPISAITHVGKVKEVIEGGEVSGKYRLIAFGDKARNKATVIELEELEELDTPVKAAKNRIIQGAEYTTLKKLKEARSLLDL